MCTFQRAKRAMELAMVLCVMVLAMGAEAGVCRCSPKTGLLTCPSTAKELGHGGCGAAGVKRVVWWGKGCPNIDALNRLPNIVSLTLAPKTTTVEPCFCSADHLFHIKYTAGSKRDWHKECLESNPSFKTKDGGDKTPGALNNPTGTAKDPQKNKLDFTDVWAAGGGLLSALILVVGGLGSGEIYLRVKKNSTLFEVCIRYVRKDNGGEEGDSDEEYVSADEG